MINFVQMYIGIISYLLGMTLVLAYANTEMILNTVYLIRSLKSRTKEDRKNWLAGIVVSVILSIFIIVMFTILLGPLLGAELMDIPQYNAGVYTSYEGVVVQTYSSGSTLVVRNSRTDKTREFWLNHESDYVEGDKVRLTCLDHSKYAIIAETDTNNHDGSLMRKIQVKAACVVIGVVVIAYMLIMMVFLLQTKRSRTLYLYRKRMRRTALAMLVVFGIILSIYCITLAGIYNEYYRIAWIITLIIWYILFVVFCIFTHCKLKLSADGKIRLRDKTVLVEDTVQNIRLIRDCDFIWVLVNGNEFQMELIKENDTYLEILERKGLL